MVVPWYYHFEVTKPAISIISTKQSLSHANVAILSPMSPRHDDRKIPVIVSSSFEVTACFAVEAIKLVSQLHQRLLTSLSEIVDWVSHPLERWPEVFSSASSYCLKNRLLRPTGRNVLHLLAAEKLNRDYSVTPLTGNLGLQQLYDLLVLPKSCLC